MTKMIDHLQHQRTLVTLSEVCNNCLREKIILVGVLGRKTTAVISPIKCDTCSTSEIVIKLIKELDSGIYPCK